MRGWHQIHLLEPKRLLGAVSAVGADNAANQTKIYGSRAFGQDLQKQVAVSGDGGRGESSSAITIMVYGTW